MMRATILFAVLIVAIAAEQGDKAGACKKADAKTVGICVFDHKVNCLKDSECIENLKCCPSGCNKTCQLPEGATAETSEPPPQEVVHPGTCKPDKTKKDVASICQFDPKIDCSGDQDCGSDLKCCPKGCRNTCQYTKEANTNIGTFGR